jgi:hypothetical protein
VRHEETAARLSCNGSGHRGGKLWLATVRRQDPTTAAPTFVFTDREKETFRVFDEVFGFQVGDTVEVDLESVSAERSNKPPILTRSGADYQPYTRLSGYLG